MKQRHHIFRRENGVYYSLDTLTKKRHSLETTLLDEARRLINAENEAARQPAINLQIARAYLQHSDPNYAQRTWQLVMDEMGRTKTGSTKKRWDVAIKDKAFDLIRDLALIKTQAEHFLDALHKGTVSTNVFLRRMQNFALDMDWIPKAVVPKRQWPAIHFKEKRAVTVLEHEAIVEREKNPERKKFYVLCWHLGAGQGDVAALKATDVDWRNRTISFTRKKTGVPVLLHLGEEALNTLKDLPSEGLLFPYLARVRACDRATEFKQRCRGLGIEGVTLHSYRYAWAERAKTCGYQTRWEEVIRKQLADDPLVKKVREEKPLTGDEEDELARKLNTPENFFNEDNLRRAYRQPGGNLIDFIRAALGTLKIKSREEKITENFQAWLVSRNFPSEQAEYLVLLKHRGVIRGRVEISDLFEPPLSVHDAATRGVELFGEQGLQTIIAEMNETVFPQKAA